MTDASIILTGKLAEQLHIIAQRRNLSIEEMLSAWLEEAQPASVAHNWALEMARMAEADTNIVWDESATDLSERSREILDRDYHDYLLKKQAKRDE